MNRFHFHIYILIAAALFLPLFSCSDDIPSLPGDQAHEPGLPARVSLRFAAGSMPSVSRADMAAGRDSEINTIWLGFFDEEGKKTHEFMLTDKADFASGKLNLELVSGRYRMAAVVNPRGNRGVAGNSASAGADLASLLMAVTSFDEYLNIALVNDDALIDTPAGNLAMQGVWVPDGTDASAMDDSDAVARLAGGYIDVPASTDDVTVSSLPGKIYFRRAVSQVKLNLSYNSANIASFEPVSIQVFNVPAVSWLAERSDADPATVNAGDVLTARLGDNAASWAGNYPASAKIPPSQLTEDEEGTYAFDWFQMENRRTGSCSAYAEREKELTDASGANTGIFTALTRYGSGGDAHAANQAATFVTINVRMVMNQPGTLPGGQPAASRTVMAKYTVHLGYCEGASEADKARDFNCRRNHKYTYNIKINDVNKIVVEAMRENQVYEHGAEGVVSVLANEMLTADAHYSVFNVEFTDEELSDFQWRIRAYHSPSGYYDITSENYATFDRKYYGWVEFRATESDDPDVIAPYKPRGSGTSGDGKTYSLTEMKGKPGGRYTMFINEYVYESSTDNGTNTPNWRSYVNLPDRTVWLGMQEKSSTDGASVIVGAKYALAQRSIQSGYGGGSGPGIGMEHVNELEGLSMTYEAGSMTGTNTDARYLTWISVASGTSPTWSKLISNKFQKVGNVNRSVPMYQEIVGTSGRTTYYTNSACLNRNRDLNGNGKIEQNEMRWFVPSAEQYVHMVMSASALASPLYEFSDYAPGTNADLKRFAAIDDLMLMAEEGMSTGSVAGAPQYQRCVRYLGVNMAQTASNPVSRPFKKRSADENIIEFSFSSEALRSPSASPLPAHRVNSPYNRPSRAFEYRIEDISAPLWFETGDKTLTVGLWFQALAGSNPCDRFNGADASGWRVPNQAELVAMMYLGVAAPGLNYVSATEGYFTSGGQPRVMGIVTGNTVRDSYAAAFDNGRLRAAFIRCVRDVSK